MGFDFCSVDMCYRKPLQHFTSSLYRLGTPQIVVLEKRGHIVQLLEMSKGV